MYRILIQYNSNIREYLEPNLVKVIGVIQNRIYRHKDKPCTYSASRELDSESLTIRKKSGIITFSYHKVV